FRAGMYEAVKYGVIRDAKLADFITQNLSRLNGLDSAALIHLIARCCEIKVEVVTADEREGGVRRILNFGHTVGHALEAVTHYRRFKHGEAVGYGMRCATAIAEKAGALSAADAATIDAQVAALGPLPRLNDLAINDIIAVMQHDKKAAQGKVPFILPTRVGDVTIRDDIAPPIIRNAVRALLAAH
ncbi:MAG: 3-dehydroquinate synthase, partial [Acidobacteria bacterium]|nr:3-dehydroquinate synthase [Acidobacteriota bacterium]